MHRKTAPLVRAAIQGSKDALGELLLMHQPIFTGYIKNFIEQRRLPMSLAEDLLQDTYEAACKSFEYYDPTVRNGNMGGLMRTIVERVCAANADLVENRRKEIPMSNIDGTDEDSEDSDWTVTDAMVVSAWAAENSPGYIESPPPLQNPQGGGGGRPRLNKPKVKKVRARRLPVEEIQRRERVRQEWATGESHPAE